MAEEKAPTGDPTVIERQGVVTDVVVPVAVALIAGPGTIATGHVVKDKLDAKHGDGKTGKDD